VSIARLDSNKLYAAAVSGKNPHIFPFKVSNQHFLNAYKILFIWLRIVTEN